MSSKQRISRNPAEFNDFITGTSTYLKAGEPVTNGVRLGLLPVEIDKWCGFAARWTPIYSKYNDKLNGYTRGTRNDIYTIMEEVQDFNREVFLLDRIKVSPAATLADLEMFNLKRPSGPKASHSAPHSLIKETVEVSFKLIKGGFVNVSCRGTSHPRPSIIDVADSIQYVYLIGTNPPASPTVPILQKELSTKSKFVINAGIENIGKTLYCYFRWYNTKYPEAAGPWTMLESTLIL